MPNINTLLDDHVVLTYEFVDRIFLNGYVSRLQTSDDLAWFLCQHQGQRLPRYELLGETTRAFVTAIEALAAKSGIPILHFEKGQSKEAAAQPFFEAAAQSQREGVVLIGIAQESVKVFRPPTRQQRRAQSSRPGGRSPTPRT